MHVPHLSSFAHLRRRFPLDPVAPFCSGCSSDRVFGKLSSSVLWKALSFESKMDRGLHSVQESGNCELSLILPGRVVEQLFDCTPEYVQYLTSNCSTP